MDYCNWRRQAGRLLVATHTHLHIGRPVLCLVRAAEAICVWPAKWPAPGSFVHSASRTLSAPPDGRASKRANGRTNHRKHTRNQVDGKLIWPPLICRSATLSPQLNSPAPSVTPNPVQPQRRRRRRRRRLDQTCGLLQVQLRAAPHDMVPAPIGGRGAWPFAWPGRVGLT